MASTGATGDVDQAKLARSRDEMPAGVRLWLVLGLAVLVGGALALMTERGPALLFDLAQAGARFLCL